MKVEIELDELCELSKNATSGGPLCYADLESLCKERDWWRNAALLYEDIILKSVRLLDEGPLLSLEAEKLGYEVPE